MSQEPSTNGHAHHHVSRTRAHVAVKSLNKLSFTATVRCLSGFATGEVLGLVIGTV